MRLFLQRNIYILLFFYFAVVLSKQLQKEFNFISNNHLHYAVHALNQMQTNTVHMNFFYSEFSYAPCICFKNNNSHLSDIFSSLARCDRAINIDVKHYYLFMRILMEIILYVIDICTTDPLR